MGSRLTRKRVPSKSKRKARALGPIKGAKFFRRLSPFLKDLQDRYNHGNRDLHYDQYLTLLLVAFFNPVVDSLRGIVDVSGMPDVARNLGFNHTSLACLSDAARLFDPEPLRKIFLELSKEASVQNGPPRPKGIPDDMALIASDGSLWKLLPRMVRQLYAGIRTRARKGELKAHIAFNVLDSVPVDADFTSGTVDERKMFLKQLTANCFYLIDRGYQSAPVFKAIVAAGSSFVARLRVNCKYTVISNRELTELAKAAGVTSDTEVSFGSGVSEQKLRVVRATVISPGSKNLDPKCKRGKHKGYARNEPRIQNVILVTDRMDLDADIVVELYRYRWHIEIFFRWFKCVLKCKHLFAESDNGMAIQFYTALIASLLVVIYTSRKPNKDLWRVLILHFQGWCDWNYVLQKIEKQKLADK